MTDLDGPIDWARLSEDAQAEAELFIQLGGDPRLRVGDRHTSNVGENTDVVPATQPRAQEKP